MIRRLFVYLLAGFLALSQAAAGPIFVYVPPPSAPTILTGVLASAGPHTSSGTNHSIASVPFGATGSNRRIVVVMGGFGGSSTEFTVSSPTIGGVAASIDHISTSARERVVIISAYVPTGNTGTVAFDTNVAVDLGFVVYQITGALSTPGTGVSDTSGPLSLAPTVAVGGFAVAGCIGRNAGTVSTTGSDWTESANYDINTGDYLAVASSGTAGAGAVTFTFGTLNTQQGAGAVPYDPA